MSSKRIAVIGGGLSGLSACYHLLKKKRDTGSETEIVLIEKDDRLGGKAWTIKEDGFLVEAGPDSFLTTKPFAIRMAEELGLKDRLIGSNPEGRTVYILWNGRLRAVPNAFLSFRPDWRSVLRSDLLSWRGKAAVFLAALKPIRIGGADVGVREFFYRLVGKEATDRIILPLLSAVYGPAEDEVSLRWTLPSLWARFATQEGRLMRSRGLPAGERSQLPLGSLFASFVGGIGELVNRLGAELEGTVRRVVDRATGIACHGGCYIVHLAAEGPVNADGLIVATGAEEAAGLVHSLSRRLASALRTLPHRPAITVSLAFRQDQLKGLPKGSGFLVAEDNDLAISGCSFSSQKFPHRALKGYHLLRCYISARRLPALMEAADEEIILAVGGALRRLFQIDRHPEKCWVFRWERAFPLYRVGHHQFLAEVEAAVRDHPGFAVAGNWLTGAGIPDCLAAGRDAAEKVWSDLSTHSLLERRTEGSQWA